MADTIIKSVGLYALGWACYLPVLNLNYFAGGGWLDVYEIYFIPLILVSMLAFFHSFVLCNPLPQIQTTLLNFTLSIGMIFVIPNIAYYVGTTGYFPVQEAFAKASWSIMLMNLLFYVSRVFLKVRRRFLERPTSDKPRLEAMR